jgi:cephalosporin hydroxylase
MASKTSWGKLSVVAIILGLAALNAYQYGLAEMKSALRAAPQETIEQYHRLFYNTPGTWGGNKWLGITAEQNPNDAWITQEIIQDVKPDAMVETGTRFGGSALLWATILEQVNPDARVITVDIEDNLTAARRHPLFQRRVDFLLGSSTAPEIVSEVARRVKGRKTLVLLDSDHSKAHVLEELRLYSPLVSVGSYLIVQDTNVHGHPVAPDYPEGPAEALAAFLPANPAFAPDPRGGRLLFTMHPRGYLKRLR